MAVDRHLSLQKTPAAGVDLSVVFRDPEMVICWPLAQAHHGDETKQEAASAELVVEVVVAEQTLLPQQAQEEAEEAEEH